MKQKELVGQSGPPWPPEIDAYNAEQLEASVESSGYAELELQYKELHDAMNEVARIAGANMSDYDAMAAIRTVVFFS